MRFSPEDSTRSKVSVALQEVQVDASATNSNQVAYVYTPLAEPERQIRLLRIHPTSDRDRALSAEIHTHDLNEDGLDYEALSHTWDENINTNELHISGAVLGITANLHAALQQLRTEQHGLFRIDAVCINQQDLQERSAQIAIMRRIFAQARHMAIWLGEDSEREDGRLGLEFLGSVDWRAIGVETYQCETSGKAVDHGVRVKALMATRQRLKVATELSIFNEKPEIQRRLSMEKS